MVRCQLLIGIDLLETDWKQALSELQVMSSLSLSGSQLVSAIQLVSGSQLVSDFSSFPLHCHNSGRECLLLAYSTFSRKVIEMYSIYRSRSSVSAVTFSCPTQPPAHPAAPHFTPLILAYIPAGCCWLWCWQRSETGMSKGG